MVLVVIILEVASCGVDYGRRARCVYGSGVHSFPYSRRIVGKVSVVILVVFVVLVSAGVSCRST